MQPQTTKRLGLLQGGWLDVASSRAERSCFRRPWIMEQTVLIPGAGRPMHDHISLHFEFPNTTTNAFHTRPGRNNTEETLVLYCPNLYGTARRLDQVPGYPRSPTPV